MASQRTPEQLKSIILKATQHLVAVGGMQNFSYPKLTAETGINAPTVYEHYKNKEALLTTCFLTIDNEIACKIANAPKSLSDGVKDLQSLDDLCWLLWLPYWNYLTADYDRTLFYWHFCNSEYYTPTVVQQRMPHVHVSKAGVEIRYSLETLLPMDSLVNPHKRDNKKIITPFLQRNQERLLEMWSYYTKGYTTPEITQEGQQFYSAS